MFLHSYKIPIRLIPLDSTVLGSSSAHALKFRWEGQPNPKFSNPAKTGKPSASLYVFSSRKNIPKLVA
jgi:hypothetical protein